jgi:hypothetical protein
MSTIKVHNNIEQNFNFEPVKNKEIEKTDDILDLYLN